MKFNARTAQNVYEFDDSPPIYTTNNYVLINAQNQNVSMRFTGNAPGVLRVFKSKSAFSRQKKFYGKFRQSEHFCVFKEAEENVVISDSDGGGGGTDGSFNIIYTSPAKGQRYTDICAELNGATKKEIAYELAVIFDSLEEDYFCGIDVFALQYDSAAEMGKKVSILDFITSEEDATFKYGCFCSKIKLEVYGMLASFILSGHFEDEPERVQELKGINKETKCADYIKNVMFAAEGDYEAPDDGTRIRRLFNHGDINFALTEPQNYYDAKDLVESAITLSLKNSFKTLQLGEEYYRRGGRNLTVFPHQKDAVLTMLAKFRGRGVLADQVGMGKTIEAGMVISEFAKRRLIRSLLVVVPNMLIPQWLDEMQSKFSIILKTIKKPSDFGADKMCIISFKNMSEIKFMEEFRHINNNDGIDMVILDETQKLNIISKNSKSAEKSEESGVEEYSAEDEVAATSDFEEDAISYDDESISHVSNAYHNLNAIKKKYCILLSATPITGNLSDLYPLVKVLYPDRYRDVEDFYTRACNGARTLREILGTVNGQNKLASLVGEIAVVNTRESVKDIEWKPKVSHTVYFKKAENQEKTPLREIDVTQKVREYLFEGDEQRARQDNLCKILDNHAHEQAIIFCSSNLEIDSVAAALKARVSGRHVYVFGKSSSPESKAAVVKKLKVDTSGILVANMASSEGINYQFAHLLINYSVLSDPIKIEQRIGRIDRIGQNSEMHIYSFASLGAREQSGYLLKFFDEKLNLFSQWNGDIISVVCRSISYKNERDKFDVVFRRAWNDVSKECKTDGEFACKWESVWNKMIRDVQTEIKILGIGIDVITKDPKGEREFIPFADEFEDEDEQ